MVSKWFHSGLSYGPEILRSEVIHSINQLKDRKAVDLDEIPAKVIQFINEEQVDKWYTSSIYM